MAPRLAQSLITLRRQVNEARGNRDKSSDGWIGDTRHSARKSDHNPNALGVVTAIDIDEDLSQGEDARGLVAALQASGDPRIKYLIYEGKITNKGDIKTWKPYHGANPHRHHVHISVQSERGKYDDATEWDLSGWQKGQPIQPPDGQSPPIVPPIHAQPELKRGTKGESVRRLQLALRANGFQIDADGDFGTGTEKAVRDFQVLKGLRPDGIAGRNTNASLGLI